MTGGEDMEIRKATLGDLEEIARVERECFPPAEAASKEAFRERLIYYPDHFWLLWDQDRLLSFVDGFVTNERILTDEMFERAQDHNAEGEWQMVFGVNTLPEYRGRGYASMLLKELIREAREQGRRGVILTCKEEKMAFYERLGFINAGESPSSHGGAKWYQMEIVFDPEDERQEETP
jgi:ribosomal protein S18 acetylase RimI-like enzyme